MASSPSRVATSGELLRLWRAVESALKSSDENRDAQGPGASRAKEALEAMARVDGVTSEVLRDTLLGVKMRPLRYVARGGEASTSGGHAVGGGSVHDASDVCVATLPFACLAL